MVDELHAMKTLIEDRFNTLTWLGQARQHPIQSNLMLKLIRAGYSPTLARTILERMPEDVGAAESLRWVMAVLERNLKTDARSRPLIEEGGVYALVGATGVGKTTTAAKLAGLCAREHGPASVGLITLDTYRVGAHDQLRSFGRMLGVVAHLAHDRAALQDLLNLLANKKMVLIDTTGLAPSDPRKREMLSVLDLPRVNRLLVLNAGGHGDTLDSVVASFKSSGVQQAVLSKIDEAAKLGPALQRPNIRCRSFAELAAEGHAALWFAGAPPAGEAVPRRLAMPAFISFEAFTQARPAADFAAVVQNLAQAMELLHVLSRDDHPAVSAARRNAKVEHLRVPMLFKGHQAYAIWALERARRDGVLVLADEADDPLLALVREQAGLYGVGEMDLLVAATAKLAPRLPGIRLRDHGSYFRDVWNHATAPAVVVDISSGANHAALIETFARSGLPTIRLFTGMARARATQVQEQTEAGGTFASVQLLRRALQDTGTLQQAARRRVASFEQANDPGWAIIWSVMGEYRQARHVT
jgi:energy-coupling factor transporter ATP-binding protein EcfA2